MIRGVSTQENGGEDWLTQRSRETKALLANRKRDMAALAQGGVSVPANELAALDRLEAKLANRERIARVRAATQSR